MKLLRLSTMAALVLAHSLPGLANDSSAGVPLGGLRTEPRGGAVINAAAISLSPATVIIDMTVAASAQGRPSLTWSGQKFGWMGESEAYADRHFPELSITVDGVAASVTDQAQVFSAGRDITKLIETARLDPWLIAETPPLLSRDFETASEKAALEATEAVKKLGDDYVANWMAKRSVKIDLKPGAIQHVRLTYKPRPAYALLRASEIGSSIRRARYCLSKSELQSLSAAVPAGGGMWSVLEYEIAVGIDDKRPSSAASVTLTTTGLAGLPGLTRTYVCGADGNGLSESADLAARPVRVDRRGVLRVMTVSSPQVDPRDR